VRDSPPSALVVVNPYEEAQGQRALRPALKNLLVEFPSMPVFAALEVRADRVEDLRTLGKWGVVQVISIAHDDTPDALVHRFRASQGRPLKALLEQVLPADTPGRARAIVDAAAEVVAVGGHGRDLARQLHLSRRTLCAGASGRSFRPRASCWRGCASSWPPSFSTTRGARCSRWPTPAATRRTAACAA
jgi:hypothetical protein